MRAYQRTLAHAVSQMDHAGVPLQRAADELVEAAFSLVAECSGESSARRWARAHFERLAAEGDESDWILHPKADRGDGERQ